VANAKIVSNAVTGGKVADNSLTGAYVDEATFGKVQDANTLDGKDWLDFVQAGSIAAREKFLTAGAVDEFWLSVFAPRSGSDATPPRPR
jgi:hypothetical protein